MMNHNQEIDEKKRLNALTVIHPSYTLSATQEYDSEEDRLMVKNFIDTLAEVALSVAARNIKGENHIEVSR